MNALADFLATNSALLVSLLALVVSLRANWTAHAAHKLNVQSKSDSDRMLVAEKRRELLNAIDKQRTVLSTLNFVTAQQLQLFAECPPLAELLPGELDRLNSNLSTIETLECSYEARRANASGLTDAAEHEEQLAHAVRLTLHLEKDVAHEQTLLDQLRQLARTAPGA